MTKDSIFGVSNELYDRFTQLPTFQSGNVNQLYQIIVTKVMKALASHSKTITLNMLFTGNIFSFKNNNCI